MRASLIALFIGLCGLQVHAEGVRFALLETGSGFDSHTLVQVIQPRLEQPVMSLSLSDSFLKRNCGKADCSINGLQRTQKELFLIYTIQPDNKPGTMMRTKVGEILGDKQVNFTVLVSIIDTKAVPRRLFCVDIVGGFFGSDSCGGAPRTMALEFK